MDVLPITQSNDKPVGRQALYSMASRHAQRAIARLVELIDSRNENVALGAARTLLDKTLPSLKAFELVDPDDNKIDVVISDFSTRVEEAIHKIYGEKTVTNKKTDEVIPQISSYTYPLKRE